MGSYSLHQSSVTAHSSARTFFMLLFLHCIINRSSSLRNGWNYPNHNKAEGQTLLCLRFCRRRFLLHIIAVNYIAVTVWTLNINCLRLPPLCCWSPLNGTLYTGAICHTYLLSSHICSPANSCSLISASLFSTPISTKWHFECEGRSNSYLLIPLNQVFCFPSTFIYPVKIDWVHGDTGPTQAELGAQSPPWCHHHC